MPEIQETEEFFDAIFRLDACNDVTEFVAFAQGARHDKDNMISAIERLLAKGSIRSAYILAMLLIKRGQKHLAMSITLSVGGTIYTNPTELENGSKYLHTQIEDLSVKQQEEVYDRLLAPVLPPLLIHLAKQGKERPMPQLLQSFKAAVPKGFDWSSTRCKVCCASATYMFHANLVKKHRVAYYLCEKCAFLSTEEPYWLEEVYTQTLPIPDPDCVARSLRHKTFVSLLLRNLFDSKGKFLDYGAGYGLFVRMMRDEGFEYYWQDKYCQNLFAQGFEGAEYGKYDLVTAFECFQHFVDPIQELDNIFARNDCLLFTTQLLPDPVPQPNDWAYYAPEQGQHVSFYSRESLQKMAASLGLVFLSNGTNTHLFSKRAISNKLFDGLAHWRMDSIAL